jgi:uridine kinase
MTTTPREQFLHALARLIADVPCSHPLRSGIDGVDASGKTSLADELVAPLMGQGRSVVRASIDGFHRPRAERYERGRQSPEGYFRDSFQLDRIVRDLLVPLGMAGSRRIKRAVFDYRNDSPVHLPEEAVPADAILLFDGVFLHRRELVSFWDATIYLDVPFEITVCRAAGRDGWPADVEAVENRRYVEGQRLYLRECNPQAVASVVVDNSDLARPVIAATRPPFNS